jgi:hypothetical protein
MSYSRNKYRCLLKPHNQNVIVSHDNNIQNPNSRYPCIYPYPGIGPDYPGYPCIGPYPYAQMQQENQPLPIPKPTPQPHLYPYGPYYPGIDPYYSGPYYGPYYGRPYPYSQKIKEKLKSKNENVENGNVENVENENVGNMKPHCEYYSSSSSDSDDYIRYRRYRRRHAKVAPETDDLESNRVFDEQNQKPYPIPKPRPIPKNKDNKDNENNENNEHQNIENSVTDKKSFAKPLAKLFTKFTTPTQNENLIEVNDVEVKDEKNEQKIYLKV